MIIDLLSEVYEGRIKTYEPLLLEKTNLPDELISILAKSNGIMETMLLPGKTEPMNVGWIIYSYDEICEQTEFYKKQYGIKGTVFSDNGAGDPYFYLDGKVYEFNAIYNESELIAESLHQFFEERVL